MDVVKDLWRDIPGYEGVYQVSKLGLVKRLKGSCNTKTGTSKRKERILTPGTNTDGYLCVNLSMNKTYKHCRVHRLIAMTFIDNPEYKPQINHKNGIKYDNWVGNLEWVTASENAIHAYRNGLRVPPNTMIGKFGKDHNASIKVGAWPCVISEVCRGNAQTSVGYGNLKTKTNYE